MTALMLSVLLFGSLAPQDTTGLYRTMLVRAAPGALIELIDAFRARSSFYEAAGDHPPFMMRHRQGDQWDLMLIFPMGAGFADYYSPARVSRRRAAGERLGSSAEFVARLRPVVAWKEELYVTGPAVVEVDRVLRSGDFYHVEMFIALPGKYEELRRERQMENTYLAALDRPQNLIFEREAGAAWDMFTVGVYEDIQHFAASGAIPPEREEEAARMAGFEGADRIGTYLRTLIDSHHDTLARAVR